MSCGPVAVPWPLQPRACAPAWRRCVPLVPNGATIPLQNTTSAMLPANQYPCQDPNGDEREGRLAFPSGGLAALGLQLGLDQGWPRRAREPGAPSRCRMHACHARCPSPAGHTSICFNIAVYACGYLIWVWHWRHAVPARRLSFGQARGARAAMCCLSGLALLMPL